MSKGPRKIEVPGSEPAADPQAHSAPSTAAAATESTATESTVQASEGGGGESAPAAGLAATATATTTTEAARSLDDHARTEAVAAQVEAIKPLVGSDKALDWSHLTTPAAIMQKINHNPDDALPNPSDIDWKAQPKSVTQILTRQGWLLRP